MKKGIGKNSVIEKNQQIKNAFVEVDPPKDINFETDEHWDIWRIFTSRRLVNDWHKAELCLLAKLVHNEYNLRRYYDLLNKSGPIIKNPRGTPVENPILRSIDTLMRMSASIQSRLGILQNFDVRGMQERAKDAMKVAERAKVSLLAKPE